MSKVIVAHFTDVEKPDSNNRFDYIVKGLHGDYTYVTSSFSHRFKRHRNKRISQINGNEIIYCYEPGYNRNVSIKRLLSHFIFGLGVFIFLIKNKPKLVYCAYPSISAAFFCSLYKHIFTKTELFIDVQDLWPESFEMVKSYRFLRFVDIYYDKLNHRIFNSASEIITVSNTFSDYLSEKYHLKCKVNTVLIGTQVRRYRQSGDKHGFLLCYVGNMSKSYDLLGFLKLMKDIDLSIKITLHLYGDGVDRSLLEDFARKNELSVEFKGFVPVEYLMENLGRYSLALNPIIKASKATIINKVADYAAAGLPVLNTQDSREYISYLSTYTAGETFSLERDNIKIVKFITRLATDRQFLETYCKGARRMASDLFNRENTYKVIFDLLER